MHLSLHITTGNDAVQTYQDLGAILQRLIDEEMINDTSDPCEGQGFPLRDRNGNQVGEWRIEEIE